MLRYVRNDRNQRRDSIDKSRQNRKEQAESIKEKQAELRAEEKERMELLISKADSVEGMVSKVGKGETEVLSGKMLDGIKSVGVDLRGISYQPSQRRAKLWHYQVL